MDMQEILLKTEEGVFSYRVAGILIRDGKVLLQRSINHPCYAIPGGHVNFGEVSEKALSREFKEEVGTDILSVRLLWIGEIFFIPWEKEDCHQICLYYLISLCDETQIPVDGIFYVRDELKNKVLELEFSWINLTELKYIDLYPINAKEKLANLSDHIEQFIYMEKL